MINYKSWALKPNLDVFTAAALWLEKNPYDCAVWSDTEFFEVGNTALNILDQLFIKENYPLEKIKKLRQFIGGKLSDREEFIKQICRFLATREQLKEIAFNSGVKPDFLFLSDIKPESVDGLGDDAPQHEPARSNVGAVKQHGKQRNERKLKQDLLDIWDSELNTANQQARQPIINSLSDLPGFADDSSEKQKPQLGPQDEKPEPASQSNNSHRIDSSNLLIPPSRKDAWFDVIHDMTDNFYTQYGTVPNETQAWAQLSANPPKGYIVTTGTDKGEKCLKMPGENPLSKSAFSRRWKNYTTNKPQ